MIKVIPGNNRLSRVLVLRHLLPTSAEREFQSRGGVLKWFYKLHSRTEKNLCPAFIATTDKRGRVNCSPACLSAEIFQDSAHVPEVTVLAKRFEVRGVSKLCYPLTMLQSLPSSKKIKIKIYHPRYTESSPCHQKQALSRSQGTQ